MDNEIKDLKEITFEISEDNEQEENAVSKTEIYENMSKDIKDALQKEESYQSSGRMGVLQNNNLPIKSPWSINKKAFVDVCLLGVVTLSFGVAFILRLVLS